MTPQAGQQSNKAEMLTSHIISNINRFTAALSEDKLQKDLETLKKIQETHPLDEVLSTYRQACEESLMARTQELEKSDYKFELMCNLQPKSDVDTAADEVRQMLPQLGGSIQLGVGDNLIAIHIHTDNVEKVKDCLSAIGIVGDCRIENLEEQINALREKAPE